jgi:hypothetical protein
MPDAPVVRLVPRGRVAAVDPEGPVQQHVVVVLDGDAVRLWEDAEGRWWVPRFELPGRGGRRVAPAALRRHLAGWFSDEAVGLCGGAPLWVACAQSVAPPEGLVERAVPYGEVDDGRVQQLRYGLVDLLAAEQHAQDRQIVPNPRFVHVGTGSERWGGGDEAPVFQLDLRLSAGWMEVVFRQGDRNVRRAWLVPDGYPRRAGGGRDGDGVGGADGVAVDRARARRVGR